MLRFWGAHMNGLSICSTDVVRDVVAEFAELCADRVCVRVCVENGPWLPNPHTLASPASCHLLTPQSLEALQPRLMLWVGRMGAAAAPLATFAAQQRSPAGTACNLDLEFMDLAAVQELQMPWDTQRRVHLNVDFLGMEGLHTSGNTTTVVRSWASWLGDVVVDWAFHAGVIGPV